MAIKIAYSAFHGIRQSNITLLSWNYFPQHQITFQSGITFAGPARGPKLFFTLSHYVQPPDNPNLTMW